MTTREMEREKTALRRYLRHLDGIALDRIVRAEKWGSGAFCDMLTNCCCVVGHAHGLTTANPSVGLNFMGRDQEEEDRASDAYERLCQAQGIGRTVAEIRALCATLVATRAAAAVASLCGEGVTR